MADQALTWFLVRPVHGSLSGSLLGLRCPCESLDSEVWVPQPVQKHAVGPLPVPETAQAEELIGSMLLLIQQREAEIHCVGPQQAEEQLADGQAPTNAHEVRCPAVHLLVHFPCGLIAPVVHRNQVWFGSARE